MINSLLLVVKKVISWPSLGLLYLSVLEEVRYVDIPILLLIDAHYVGPMFQDQLGSVFPTERTT